MSNTIILTKIRKTGVPSTSLSNPEVAQLRTKAYNLLITDRGKELRKQRCHDVETVFAQIKNNKGFRRYNLRGKTKTEVETALLAMAHNLKKCPIKPNIGAFLSFFKMTLNKEEIGLKKYQKS